MNASTHPSNPPATAENFAVQALSTVELARWIDSKPPQAPACEGAIYKHYKIGEKYLVIWARPIEQPTK
jgi:hypothetical protein